VMLQFPCASMFLLPSSLSSATGNITQPFPCRATRTAEPIEAVSVDPSAPARARHSMILGKHGYSVWLRLRARGLSPEPAASAILARTAIAD
jgi:hypothetical protein